jgi:imidazolonepropionase-like amidohydrolase
MKASLRFGFLAAIAGVALATPVCAQSASVAYAIAGAKVYTLAGAPIENATVIIENGKITAVGQDVKVPAGAEVIDAKGLEVYPGMFDPITQMGLDEVGAVSATVDITELGDANPDVVAATAVNPASAHIDVTRASGITHVVSVPGVGGFGFFGGAPGLIGGQASAIHLSGWTIDEMLIRRSVAMVVLWPSLETSSFDFSTFSFKERPYSEVKQEYDKQVNKLIGWFERARHYAQAQEKGSPERFERDLKLEAMVPVIQGKLPVLVVASEAREIRSAIEFCTKQGLRMILAGGAEAWKVKDLLKQKNIPVILEPTERLPLNEDDPYDKPFTEPAELNSAGIPIAFSSFGTRFSRRLPFQAGTAVAYGLPHDEALKAVTINAAKMLGLDGEFGTIEPGKTANLIVTNGDPLEIRTELRYLFVKGQLTNTENKHHQLYEEYRKRP